MAVDALCSPCLPRRCSPPQATRSSFRSAGSRSACTDVRSGARELQGKRRGRECGPRFAGAAAGRWADDGLYSSPTAATARCAAGAARGQHAALHIQEEKPWITPSVGKTIATSSSISSSRRSVLTSAGAEAGEADADAGPLSSLKMPFYFFLWYGFNIIFNIYNKQTLNAFPYPYFLSTIQLGFGVAFMAVLWATRIQRLPSKIDKGFFMPLAAVSLFHTIGHVSSCVSFSKMAVSFTHVIKSAEPVFSVIMSSIFFGQSYSVYIWLSLIPIVLGCSFAAMKEVR